MMILLAKMRHRIQVETSKGRREHCLPDWYFAKSKMVAVINYRHMSLRIVIFRNTQILDLCQIFMRNTPVWQDDWRVSFLPRFHIFVWCYLVLEGNELGAWDGWVKVGQADIILAVWAGHILDGMRTCVINGLPGSRHMMPISGMI